MINFYAKLFSQIYSLRNVPDFYNHNSEYDTDWTVWKEGNKIFINFKGTTSFKDILIDLWFWKSSVEAYDGASWKAHTGFKKQYYAVRKDVLDYCKNLYEDGDSFIILGHSLGGAIALLASEDIGWHFNTKVRVLTWGAPRVTRDVSGQKAINNYLTEDSYNFEIGNDPVPYLPGWFMPSPRVVKIGKRFNLLKCIINLILIHKEKYHSMYHIDELYPTENL